MNLEERHCLNRWKGFLFLWQSHYCSIHPWYYTLPVAGKKRPLTVIVTLPWIWDMYLLRRIPQCSTSLPFCFLAFYSSCMVSISIHNYIHTVGSKKSLKNDLYSSPIYTKTGVAYEQTIDLSPVSSNLDEKCTQKVRTTTCHVTRDNIST